MAESEFHKVIDDIYIQIEDQIDESGADLDYETSGGVMTITCESDSSKVILSRQPTTGELWVAARSGGFHFRMQDSDWVCASGENLAELLERVIQEQNNETLTLSFS